MNLDDMQNKRNICILGSTGSIGRQTLDVIDRTNGYFRIASLTTNNNIDLLEKQCSRYHPKSVAIVNENAYYKFKQQTNYKGKILCGESELIEVASDTHNDLVVSSLVGFAGVKPTLAAIQNKIDIALANKEVLVAAGQIVVKAAKENSVKILPIDSEHSAILQCLAGESHRQIDKLILTASGGPFFNTPKNELKLIKSDQALNHPNWSMGNKVTIDSATMMNKGFEVIEAHWLFDIGIDKIKVLMHPQSIVHSMVQFVDSSMKAQLGVPDMRIPISYALTYPDRYTYDFPQLKLFQLAQLNFCEPDLDKFPCLQLAFDAINQGGNAPAIVNAANEIAVDAFINHRIGFYDIPKFIEQSLKNIHFVSNPTLNDIFETNEEARKYVLQLI